MTELMPMAHVAVYVGCDRSVTIPVGSPLRVLSWEELDGVVERLEDARDAVELRNRGVANLSELERARLARLENELWPGGVCV